ncbi:MAG TPA: site-2 protease family protein [Myxococcota bacterium]|jgi:Zn-dependent protease|nr:site-2 protease family protein [Myxococcota bacterium]
MGGIRIARIAGIPIYLHPTWFLVFFLVTWLLSEQLRATHPGTASAVALLVGGATSLLFAASIVLHELGHSVLARHHRVPVRSITLFVFGGIAAIERDAETPRAELEIAIAGPIVSALLGLVFVLLERVAPEASAWASMADWLMRINLGVAIFNLLPGFPLDGGRVLRAFLWARTGSASGATRTAARAGQWIAYAFIAFGALRVMGGDLGGLWLAFIGWFLVSASGSSIQQAAIGDALAGLRARDVVSPDVPRIGANASVGEFARRFAMRGQRWALVEEGPRVVGLVSLTDVKHVAPDAWESTRIASIATPIEKVETASPESPVLEVLRQMAQRDVNQIPVRDGDRILGAISRDALLQLIDLRRQA